MITARGKTLEKLNNEIYKTLKEANLNDSVSAIVNYDRDDFLIPEYDVDVMVFTKAGSNEGWYITLAIARGEKDYAIEEVIGIRVQDSLDSTIAIQSYLLKNLEL